MIYYNAVRNELIDFFAQNEEYSKIEILDYDQIVKEESEFDFPAIAVFGRVRASYCYKIGIVIFTYNEEKDKKIEQLILSKYSERTSIETYFNDSKSNKNDVLFDLSLAPIDSVLREKAGRQLETYLLFRTEGSRSLIVPRKKDDTSILRIYDDAIAEDLKDSFRQTAYFAGITISGLEEQYEERFGDLFYPYVTVERKICSD